MRQKHYIYVLTAIQLFDFKAIIKHLPSKQASKTDQNVFFLRLICDKPFFAARRQKTSPPGSDFLLFNIFYYTHPWLFCYRFSEFFFFHMQKNPRQAAPQIKSEPRITGITRLDI